MKGIGTISQPQVSRILGCPAGNLSISPHPLAKLDNELDAVPEELKSQSPDIDELEQELEKENIG